MASLLIASNPGLIREALWEMGLTRGDYLSSTKTDIRSAKLDCAGVSCSDVISFSCICVALLSDIIHLFVRFVSYLGRIAV
jgi:hypothetical protein